MAGAALGFDALPPADIEHVALPAPAARPADRGARALVRVHVPAGGRVGGLAGRELLVLGGAAHGLQVRGGRVFHYLLCRRLRAGPQRVAAHTEELSFR